MSNVESGPTDRNTDTTGTTQRRTARDLYTAAVMRRIGLQQGERNIDSPAGAMSAGEMLAWALGGSVMDTDLWSAIVGAGQDLERIISQPVEDAGDEANRDEAWQGIAQRLRVIAAIHMGALDVLRQVPADALELPNQEGR